jgi:hypothetical protein
MLRLFLLGSLALAPLADGLALPPRESVVEISIMELTQVEWSPGKRLPEKITALDGRKVKVTGFMALDTPEGTSSFRLTFDQCGCANAKANHFVQVDLGEKTVGYQPDEISLTGTFAVGEEREDGFVVSLYRLKAASME